MRAVLIILLFLLIPSALAITVSDVSVTQSGKNISWIKTANAYKVDISFTLDKNTTAVIVDARSLNADWQLFRSSRDYRTVPAMCSAATGKNRCYISNLDIKPTTTQFSLPFNATVNGTKETSTIPLRFQIDDSKPKLLSIEVGTCTPQTCYTKPGPVQVRIKYSDSTGAMNKRMVFFNYGGAVEQAISCKDGLCTGIATRACTSGQKMTLTLASKGGFDSQDDAGNVFANNILQNVTCDSQPPTIENVTYSPVPATSKAALVIKAIVSDDTGVSKTWASSSLKQSATGTCKDKTCTYTFTNLPKIFTQAEFSIEAEDFAGNTPKPINLTIPILEYVEGGRPDLFTTQVLTSQISPRQVNRVVLQLSSYNNIPYRLHVPYTITPNKEDARVVETIVRGCMYQTRNESTSASKAFNDPSVDQPYSSNSTNGLMFTFRTNVFAESGATAKLLHNEFTLNCTIALRVRDTNKLYGAYEEETLLIPVTMREAPVGEMGEVFANKIKDAEDNFFVNNKILKIANTVIATASDLCAVQDNLQYVEMTGVGIKAVGSILRATVALAPIGNTMINVGGVTFSTAQGITDKFYNSETKTSSPVPGAPQTPATGSPDIGAKFEKGVTDLFRKACSMSSCVQSKDEQDSSTFGGYMLDEVTVGMYSRNPGNSIGVALAQQCWPAVVFGLNKYRQTQCNYLECLKGMSINGQPVSTCEDVKNAQICEAVTGEAIEIIPGVNVFKNLAENARFLLQNMVPVTLKNLLKSVGPCKDSNKKNDDFAIWACQIPKSIFQMYDYESVTKTSQEFHYPAELPDLCVAAMCNSAECKQERSASVLGGQIPDFRLDKGASIAAERDRQQRNVMDQWLAFQYYVTTNGEGKDNVDWNALKKQGISQEAVGRAMNDPAAYSTLPDYLKQADSYYSDKAKESGLEESQYDSLDAKLTTWAGLHPELHLPVEGGVAQPDPLKRRQTPIANAEDAKQVSDTITTFQETATLWDKKFATDVQWMTDNGVSTATLDRTKTQRQEFDKQSSDFVYNLLKNGVITNEQAEQIVLESSYENNGYLDLSNSPTLQKSVLGMEQVKGKWTCAKKPAAGTECARKKEYDHAQTVEQVRQSVDFAVRWIFANTEYKKYLQLKGWGSWGMGMSEDIDRFLSSDSWKQSACNPDGLGTDQFAGTNVGRAYMRSAYGTYKPVLSFAVEKQEFNSSHTLYTFTLYAGGVPDKEYEMEVQFKGTATKTPLTKKLSAGEAFTYSKSFLSKNTYDQMCVRFDSEFPPNDIAKNTEYCRSITFNGEWNLGNPVALDANGNPILEEGEREIWNDKET
ncbi:MAG: hypothetical protein ABIA93_02185 [Candidatus Woesearchaeota archaeon]